MGIIEHFGKTVIIDGIKFPSEKEANFYLHFIKNCGKNYHVHPSYSLIDKFQVGGNSMRGISYAPDFVIFEGDEIAHVYDVKTSLSQLAIDSAAKLRFKLFALRYGIPVEVVVPRKHDFKTKFYGFSDPRLQTPHARHDRHGNVKLSKRGTVMYEYYDVHRNVNYDIHDTIGG